MQVDLNCDMGESYGPYKIGNDEEMMQHISSSNIACGWHGGDPMVMDRTVQMAAERGVGWPVRRKKCTRWKVDAT